MTDDESDFRPRPGKIRSAKNGKPKTFLNQVLRAAKKAGSHSAGSGSGTRKASGPSRFGRGRYVFGRSRLFSSSRRVTIKTRITRQTGKAYRSSGLSQHLTYLKREGVTRDGDRAEMFDAASDQANESAFVDRCKDDRHLFRFIIAPEDAAEMEDLRSFTRDLAHQMEKDLGTKLEWVAVDHWNTDNPHVHLLVRGVDQTGADLVISRDYISHGMRSRAEDLASLELGPKPEHEIRSSLERETIAERWTNLDRQIKSLSDELGVVDLRPERPGPEDPLVRRLMLRRLQYLENLGLAAGDGAGLWTMKPEAELRLRDLGMRGDIIKTMHRAFSEKGVGRKSDDYVIDLPDHGRSIIGRLVATGLHDELSGEAYAIIEGVDGRAHHVRFKGVEAFDQAPPYGGIVEVRRFGGLEDKHPTLVLANRSDIDISRQVTAPGATWLDHRLVERTTTNISRSGFGEEVHRALNERAEHLIKEGHAQREGDRVLLRKDLLTTLRNREVYEAGARIAQERGRTFTPTSPGCSVSGTYRETIRLSSGRFAMINDGLGFQLVPWSPSLEKNLDRQVSGIVRSDGGVDWRLGKSRGLGL
jgi:type IV secretory pathway VirD2 relaxase